MLRFSEHVHAARPRIGRPGTCCRSPAWAARSQRFRHPWIEAASCARAPRRGPAEPHQGLSCGRRNRRWPRAGRPTGACPETPACRRVRLDGSTNVAIVKVRYPAPKRMPEPAAEIDRLQATVLSRRGHCQETPPSRWTSGSPWNSASAAKSASPRRRYLPSTRPTSADGGPRPRSPPPSSVCRAKQERRAGDPRTAPCDAEACRPLARADDRSQISRRWRPAPMSLSRRPRHLTCRCRRSWPAAATAGSLLVDLSRAGNAEELKGKELIVTLVSDSGASEASVRLRLGAAMACLR